MDMDDNEDDDISCENDKQYVNFIDGIASLEGSKRFVHIGDDNDDDEEDDDDDDDGRGPQKKGGGGGGGVTLDSLLNVLQDKKVKKKVKKSISFSSSSSKDKVSKKSERKEEDDDVILEAPGSKKELDKEKRFLKYKETKKSLGKWEGIVQSRRAATTVSYPLEKPDLALKTGTQHAFKHKIQTPLEQQVLGLLASGNPSKKSDGNDDEEQPKNLMDHMTLQEAIERRRDLQKMRALESYAQAKLKRQSKIKSKKYRKILRKQKEREKLKELEILRLENPELAAQHLQEMEKSRIMERANLKHRNGSKYLQEISRRAKYDKGTKDAVNEQLKKHREILEKKNIGNSDDDDDDDDDDDEELNIEEHLNVDSIHENNPWIAQQSDENEPSFNDFADKYKKFQKDKNKSSSWENKKEIEKERLQMTETIDDLFHEADSILKSKLHKKIKNLKGAAAAAASKESQDLITSTNNDETKVETEMTPIKQNNNKTDIKKVDPNQFIIGTKPTKELELKGELSDDSENDDEEEEARKTIAEAFADDDVIDEFTREKSDIIEKSKKKGVIDMSLPGWGEWGGNGIQISKRKRKKFTVKNRGQSSLSNRKDANKGHLIINEEKNSEIRKHQVSQVPFPFTTVADFEASIRTPVGDTFVPRTAFKKMVQPKVKTKMGTVIEPMDSNQLVKRMKMK